MSACILENGQPVEYASRFDGDRANLGTDWERIIRNTVTVDNIRCTMGEDDQYQLLKTQIKSGWLNELSDTPADLREYTTFVDKLVISDKLIYKGQRVLIPRMARADILARIHNSHIGVHGYIWRAREAVLWPGMTKDIQQLVARCAVCEKYQAANKKEPIMSHDIPSRLWEKVGLNIFVSEELDSN